MVLVVTEKFSVAQAVAAVLGVGERKMGLPSSEYLNTLCEGYLSAGFEPDPLKEAVAFSGQ